MKLEAFEKNIGYTFKDKNLLDKSLAKFYALSRKKEDIETFIQTGKFPERPKYIPKDEYFKNKQQNLGQQSAPGNTQINNTQSIEQFNDPFMFNSSVPRKV